MIPDIAGSNRTTYSIAPSTVCNYSYPMRITITLLRQNGFRVSTEYRELSGQLFIHERHVSQSATRLAAELHGPSSMMGKGENLLAVLFDPKIRSWQGATFKLNGWEIIDWKGDGRQLVVQEWACRIDGF